MQTGSERAEMEDQLQGKLAAEFPELDVHRVPGIGWEAYPKGTVVTRAMDLDVLARKLRKQRDGSSG